MAYLGLLGATRASRWIGWIIWALLAVAIGFSRFGLGVHWPTDVVAGTSRVRWCFSGWVWRAAARIWGRHPQRG